jgi:hypothetical protein
MLHLLDMVSFPENLVSHVKRAVAGPESAKL